MKLLYVHLLHSRPLLWYLSKFTIASCFQQLTLVISIFSQLIKYSDAMLWNNLSFEAKTAQSLSNCKANLPLCLLLDHSDSLIIFCVYFKLMLIITLQNSRQHIYIEKLVILYTFLHNEFFSEIL